MDRWFVTMSMVWEDLCFLDRARFGRLRMGWGPPVGSRRERGDTIKIGRWGGMESEEKRWLSLRRNHTWTGLDWTEQTLFYKKQLYPPLFSFFCYKLSLFRLFMRRNVLWRLTWRKSLLEIVVCRCCPAVADVLKLYTTTTTSRSWEGLGRVGRFYFAASLRTKPSSFFFVVTFFFVCFSPYPIGPYLVPGIHQL